MWGGVGGWCHNDIKVILVQLDKYWPTGTESVSQIMGVCPLLFRGGKHFAHTEGGTNIFTQKRRGQTYLNMGDIFTHMRGTNIVGGWRRM